MSCSRPSTCRTSRRTSATLLGNPQTSVIGNVVQTHFLNRNDYPTAAAVRLVLVAIITVLVLIYAKFLGTEDLA
jgi:spermidine/putrescine transport system permease protein